MLAQLGTYIFEGFQAPDSMSTKDAAKYGRITLVNGKDVIQKTGDQLSELSLTLKLSSVFCEPAEVITGLKQSMAGGEILPLIMGDGTIVGKYVLTGVDVTYTSLASDGAVDAAQIVVSLLEYSGVEEETQEGTALESADPIPEEPEEPIVSAAESITEDVAKATSKVKRMKQILANAKGKLTEVRKKIKEIRQLAAQARDLYASAKTKVEVTKKIINRAKNLPTSLGEAMNYAENLTRLGNTADLTLIENQLSGLSDSADKVGINTAPVTSFLITREGGEE